MQPNKLRATWPFQALADDTRLRIVRLLSCSGMEATPGQIAMTFHLPPSHLSRHLQILVWVGLISLSRKGRSSVAKITRTESFLDALCSSVLSMPDDLGVFGGDLERFLAIALTEPLPNTDAQAKEG